MNLRYPEDLPVCAHKARILAAIRSNAVVIVCGETGSGKTTQLPKMLLELGYGGRGIVGCTQPRRIAATEMARRVAAELGCELGAEVGFQHRFSRRTSQATRVKFMTDGVLLAELKRDRLLRAYDAIIVDEAHERSLNIDVLLGFLKQILSRRRHFRVVISSATLDATLFSDFFGGAPVIEVPGKRFPVEIRYMPPEDSGDADLSEALARAITTLPVDGDILAFLPGERDIREAAESLSAHGSPTEHDDILPLMASLPPGEQQRVFRQSSRRKIVLSTNVAETSLTIPGIRYVIDSGLARIPRFIHRSGVQRLQIEGISQASANQRAGRCGRIGPGICIRIYAEDDFNRRPQFSAPEILRTSLAGMVLGLLDMGVHDVAAFPLPTPPEHSMLRTALDELRELGAIEGAPSSPALAKIGRDLVRMPVEPRIGRMILEAAREHSTAMVLPVAAFLSCEDPRRHSIEDRDRARESYAKFKTPSSDFASILKMWQWWRNSADGLSQNKRRRLCKDNYLSFNRMSEWQEIWRQLCDLSARLGIDASQDSGGDVGFHRALLSGLLSHVGKYHDGDGIYRGARGTSFSISPASVLRRSSPPWIFSAEIVDTRRPLASIAASISPDSIEKIAGGLCRHAFRAPEWDPESGFVRALEDVTLFGLELAAGRRCDYSRIDPAASRDIFIRRGLLDGDCVSPPRIVADNAAAVSQLRSAAAKLHRPELFDEDALAAYFDDVIPAEICSLPALKRWLAAASAADLKRFRLDLKQWLPEDLPDSSDMPDAIVVHGVRFPLEYHDTESSGDDAIVCTATLKNAYLLRSWRSDWLVPGLLPDKLAWMISCLPAAQRRILSPTSDYVARLMTWLRPGERPLAEAVADALYRNCGIPVRPDAWDGVKIPAIFSVRFVILDRWHGRPMAEGRKLSEVLAAAGIDVATGTLRPSSRSDAGQAATAAAVASHHVKWDFGLLPQKKAVVNAGWKVARYNALRDCGDGVEIVAFDTADEAERCMRDGLSRLLVFSLGPRAASQLRIAKFSFGTALYLKSIGYGENTLAADILFGAVRETAVTGMPLVYSEQDFNERCILLRKGVAANIAALSTLAIDTLNRAASVLQLLETDSRITKATRDGIATQLSWLVFAGFAKQIPLERLRHYPRYFDAVTVRLDRARTNPAADAARQQEIDRYWSRYRNLIANDAELRRADRSSLVEYRWMVEEMRVSLFAQELKTPSPVSAKRLDSLWAKVIHTP